MSAKKKTCTICEREMVERYRPFCSRRCADKDLAGWFGESYRLTEQAPFEEMEPEDMAALEEALAEALSRREEDMT